MVYQIPIYKSMSANTLHDNFFLVGQGAGIRRKGDFRQLIDTLNSFLTWKVPTFCPPTENRNQALDLPSFTSAVGTLTRAKTCRVYLKIFQDQYMIATYVNLFSVYDFSRGTGKSWFSFWPGICHEHLNLLCNHIKGCPGALMLQDRNQNFIIAYQIPPTYTCIWGQSQAPTDCPGHKCIRL